MLEPLDRIQFDAAALIEEHPPQWVHPNKQAIFDAIRSANHSFSGRIVYARWPDAQLPDTVPQVSRFEVHPGYFEYGADVDSRGVHWHLNFADPDLFFAYDSSLFAQDELQVMEHPILGSIREALDSMGKPPVTEDSRGRPTPVTISGVQRRCAVDTEPNPDAGRPNGLYGNAFARAPRETVLAATTVLAPPTISNILAIAAPACGHGEYTREQIEDIVVTAYTGFLAARLETGRLAAATCRTVIHTGFWGCGAFGGNRTLMTILQALAADLAEVDVVFHAADEAGILLALTACEDYRRGRDSNPAVPQILEALAQQRFKWGVSDGN